MVFRSAASSLCCILLAAICGCAAAEPANALKRNDARPDAGPGSQAKPIDVGDASLGDDCKPVATEDHDKDGFSIEDGDCADCDPQINPGAFDFAGNGIDEDCSGKADSELADCDTGLPLEGDATAAAKSLGLCRTAAPNAPAKERTWGLVSARYAFPDGTTASLGKAPEFGCSEVGAPPNPLSHGIHNTFGSMIKARQGASLLALSTGMAQPGHINDPRVDGVSPGSAHMCTRSQVPDGFPISSYASCGELKMLEMLVTDPKTANDGIALELVIRAPTNAVGVSFEFNFHTTEYNRYVCTNYNDAFVALLDSKSPDLPANRNVAFDVNGDPVCVNNAFVEVCAPWKYEGKRDGKPFSREFTCKLGADELNGTGFELRAATGWLRTRATIVPGEELTLRFALWDAGDDMLDSTVLLDNLQWDVKPGTTITERPTVK